MYVDLVHRQTVVRAAAILDPQVGITPLHPTHISNPNLNPIPNP